ncbi:Y4yA family PLP-dependent enzyme [Gimesia sp.]|uniref:Y4yA family PLP-dependent enzyme n=1 Tax=Gimesia sp. TaxID=2024833 RepID=UPI003A920C77
MNTLQIDDPALSSRFENEENPERLREYCRGVAPLPARLETWMQSLCSGPVLAEMVQEYGSPLNLLCTEPFQRNINLLRETAGAFQLDFEVYFARKANKCLAFVEAANQLGCGIDTASTNEVRQSLALGVPAEKIICTAAVKSEELLRLCIKTGITISIDNVDELLLTQRLAREAKRQTKIALRISGFTFEDRKLNSRFGFDIMEIPSLVQRFWSQGLAEAGTLCISGLHFHLDGYSRQQRIAAIRQLLPCIDILRSKQHPVTFLDMGGGIPMNYLESKSDWELFWREHRLALLGNRPPLTWENHGLGLIADEGRLLGKPKCYPYYQSPVQQEWLKQLLQAESEETTIAESLCRRKLQLRCEPGRSVLDGCGMTVARVEFRKQHSNGHWFIGLSMNRTQCRTSSDDFLVDPLLIPAGKADLAQEPTVAIEGYLVGAYCTESEFLSLRRLQFPQGVSLGDLIVFPNTAGYFMHFLESRSHQFPLAQNVFFDPTEEQFNLDLIDKENL